MTKSEQQPGEYRGYVFGPTQPALRDSEGNIARMPANESADRQNRITTAIEMQLASHLAEIERLTPEQVTQLSDDHREAALPTFVPETTIE